MVAEPTRPVNQEGDRYFRCEACGRWGRAGMEVRTTLEYVGGHGYEERTWHVNKLACWKYQDEDWATARRMGRSA